MIKNVVFDIGNVLVQFRPKQYMQALGLAEKTAEKLESIIFKDRRWNEFDRGVLMIEDYAETLKNEHPELKVEISKIFQEGWVPKLFAEKYESIEFLKEYSSKYDVYLLSNISEKVYRYIESLDFFKYVKGGTYSYTIKVCKPEKEIFTNFLETYGLIAEECLFLDDSAKNIDAAKKIGFQTIVFNDNLEEVKKLLK